MGVKEIFKSLKNNNIVCFAADQVPRRGFGEYIDFFNVKAYTTTLVQSLVNKTEANVMYFFIQSSPDNDINIILEHCNKGINNDSEHTLLLNKDIERFIMNRPADYSWEYKRFKRSKNYQIIFIKTLNYFDQNIGVRIINKVNISSLPRSIANAKTVLLKVLIDE